MSRRSILEGCRAGGWGTRRARVQGRPPGLKAAAHRAARDSPLAGAGLDPGDPCGPWEQENAGRPKPAPPSARRPDGPRCPAGERRGAGELAFDNHKERENYTKQLTGSVHTSRGLPHL
jgi:hypothetical protein